ncbi:MAG: czcA 6 [Gemmataceae bacterium]|nr:czcA 6 [Gemmataceae bacterium]
MLTAVIDWSLNNRLIVLFAFGLLSVGGLWAARTLPIDAFPDTTPVQVQINTAAPTLSPEAVERQITFRIEQALGGLPNLKEVRSISRFGLSQVVVTFHDGTDIYLARQQVSERLATIDWAADAPRPKLGPVSTGLGEVFHYAITGDGYSLEELRTLHDWVIRPTLRTVPGVAEVNTWGGLEKQYQVRADPDRMAHYGVSLGQVLDALRAGNKNAGGGVIGLPGEAAPVHGLGQATNAEAVARVVVGAKAGTPIYLKQVADVAPGHDIRRGAVTADGKGEVVLGLGFMLMGENSHEVTRRLKAKLKEVEPTLPPGVRVVYLYDRTELVDHVIDTVRSNLFEGGLLVIAVLFVFLGDIRAGLIVALAIPVSMTFAFLGMWRFAIAGSLLSLGALDFGLVVDSSVVLVENCVRQLAHRRAVKRPNPPAPFPEKEGGAEAGASSPPRPAGGLGEGLPELPSKLDVIRDAAVEVRKPTLFGELIILIVYVPILTLEGVEGKLFRPMALTVICALLGSLVLSMTLMPVLASLFLPAHPKETEPLPVRAARVGLMPLLAVCLRFRWAVLGAAVAAVVVAGMLLNGHQAQFVPRLSEGAITLTVKRLAGVDVAEVTRMNTRMEKHLLKEFPDEVEHVWSRCGVADVATDPMGIEETDVFIALKPRARWTRKIKADDKPPGEWKTVTTQAELMTEVEKEMAAFPGQVVAYSQPIEQRVNEMIAGTKGGVAVKVYGDDFGTLTQIVGQVEAILKEVDPKADVTIEQLAGQPVLQVEPRLPELARYNLPAKTVMDYVEANGGIPVGEVIEGERRFPLVVRLAEAEARTPLAFGRMQIPAPGGELLPLDRLAQVRMTERPATISREWGRRRTVIACNPGTEDVAGFVTEARNRVTERVKLSPGYRIEWGGSFENLQRFQARMAIVVPLALVCIFVLLYMSFHSLPDAVRVFLGVPFAVVGGVVALVARGLPFSVSAGVGFIALSGVAVLNSLLLVTAIRQLRELGLPPRAAVIRAVRERVRPVLMTALVASLGFVPMAVSTGMGAEVQRPLATVVIGGVVSSTLLTLLVLPAIYVLFDRSGQRAVGSGPPAVGSGQKSENGEPASEIKDQRSEVFTPTG